MDGYQARETEQSFVGHDTTSLSFLIISICHGPSSVMHFNEIKNKNKNKNIYFVYFKLYNILLVLLNGHMCRRGHSG